MSSHSEELLGKTITIWQPFSSSVLSEEDAREVTKNITGLFSLLLEWKRKDDEETKDNKERK